MRFKKTFVLFAFFEELRWHSGNLAGVLVVTPQEWLCLHSFPFFTTYILELELIYQMVNTGRDKHNRDYWNKTSFIVYIVKDYGEGKKIIPEKRQIFIRRSSSEETEKGDSK
jgi:hypothetical protein